MVGRSWSRSLPEITGHALSSLPRTLPLRCLGCGLWGWGTNLSSVGQWMLPWTLWGDTKGEQEVVSPLKNIPEVHPQIFFFKSFVQFFGGLSCLLIISYILLPPPPSLNFLFSYVSVCKELLNVHHPYYSNFVYVLNVYDLCGSIFLPIFYKKKAYRTQRKIESSVFK